MPHTRISFYAVIACLVLADSTAALAGDLSVNAGGLSADAEVNAGPDGVSAGAEVSAGGRDISADIGADDNGLSGGGDLSAGTRGLGAAGGLGGGSGAAAAPDSATAAAPSSRPKPNARAASVPARTVALPAALRRNCRVASECRAKGDAAEPRTGQNQPVAKSSVDALPPIPARAGTPVGTVVACREGIIQSARPYGPVRIDAISAGRVKVLDDGGQAAPLTVRIVYAKAGGWDVKQARVECRLDAENRVVALKSI